MTKTVRVIPISIIIPAYNVAEWLDECLESITEQTFDNFEVLLINDGSTDDTENKCVSWADRDQRINYIKVKHSGLSSARNNGIRHANGEYLMFVDSDDWVEKDYVEKLYKKAIISRADIVECDFWRYNNNTSEKTYRPSYGRMGIAYTTEERMIYGESVAWKGIYKRDFWMQNNIQFPDCLGASHVTYVLLNMLGASFDSVREPLYYYRRMRKGSILDSNGASSSEQGRMGLKELDMLLEELHNRGLLSENRHIINRIIKHRLSDLLAAQYTRKEYPEYKLQRDNYYAYITKMAEDYHNYKYIVVGGYNLNRILSYVDSIQDPYCRFNFSSIISISEPIENDIRISHSNKYRQKMIEKDIHSSLWNVLDEIKPTYLFMDLIDDRFDVVKSNGGFFTYSEAYKQVDDDSDHYEIIKENSKEYIELWEKATKVFFERVYKFVDQRKIVIVENYLSTSHGSNDTREEYKNKQEIECINASLKRKYEYIRKLCPNVIWIDAYKENLYYTDDEYEYGALPEHLNEVVNKTIARRIEIEIYNRN